MNKCQNPLCAREIPARKKYCSSTCGAAIRQQSYRQRHKKPDKSHGAFRKQSTAGRVTTNVERLKNRPLFVQEKQPAGCAQAPPPPSGELAKVNAVREARKAEEVRAAIEKLECLIRKEPSARNLRNIYFNGTTFEMSRALANTRSRREKQKLLNQSGMWLQGGGLSESETRAQFGLAVFGYELATDELYEAKKYMEQVFERDDPKCGHGKPWSVECEFCELQTSYEEIAEWNEE